MLITLRLSSKRSLTNEQRSFFFSLIKEKSRNYCASGWCIYSADNEPRSLFFGIYREKLRDNTRLFQLERPLSERVDRSTVRCNHRPISPPSIVCVRFYPRSGYANAQFARFFAIEWRSIALKTASAETTSKQND